MKESGGLKTFFPEKGDFIREGGLIEDMWYARISKSTISLIVGCSYQFNRFRAFSIHRIPYVSQVRIDGINLVKITCFGFHSIAISTRIIEIKFSDLYKF